MLLYCPPHHRAQIVGRDGVEFDSEFMRPVLVGSAVAFGLARR